MGLSSKLVVVAPRRLILTGRSSLRFSTLRTATPLASKHLKIRIDEQEQRQLASALNLLPNLSSGRRFLSSTAAATSSTDIVEPDGPKGDLFTSEKEIGMSLIGKTGSIRRTFGPRSNAEAMLTCGGEALAAHASFDPDYMRAQGWIRHHAVGPAVLSPILISGLVGALVEATFPQSVPDSQSMKVLRPLIVGVEIIARIEVVDVVAVQSGVERGERRYGYTVHLRTEVTRVRDDLCIAEGSHSIWIPDYLRM